MKHVYRIPAGTEMGAVHLRVRDLERSLAFYVHLLGFRPIAVAGQKARLSATGSPPELLILEEDPAAVPKPAGTTGLYHFAIRFPDRPSLARAFLRLHSARWPFHGFSDHLVSEAIYLPDPDGNGIEIYCDRPRSSWRWQAGEVAMATRPLNLEDLVASAGFDPDGERQLPPGTRIGHIHLHVAALGAAEAFYAGQLGLNVTARSYPGALFFAAGDYHHHVGANIWAGVGAPRPPERAVGLLSYSLLLPNAEDLAHLLDHLREAGAQVQQEDGVWQVLDPGGIPVCLQVANSPNGKGG